MRISINQTPGHKPVFGFTIKWDISGIFVASVEQGNYNPNNRPNSNVLPSLLCMWEMRSDLIWNVVGTCGKDAFQWRQRTVSSLRQIVGITYCLFSLPNSFVLKKLYFVTLEGFFFFKDSISRSVNM